MEITGNLHNFQIKKDCNSSSWVREKISEEWLEPGIYTWVAPLTCKISLQVAGGGGGGCLYNLLGSEKYATGGNGELIEQTVYIEKNTQYQIKVGKGGLGSTSLNLNFQSENGEESYFDSIMAQAGTFCAITSKEIIEGESKGNGLGGQGGYGSENGENGYVKILQ